MSVQPYYINTTSRRPGAHPSAVSRRCTASHLVMNEIGPLLRGCAEQSLLRGCAEDGGAGRPAFAPPPPPAPGPGPGPTGVWRVVPGASAAALSERPTGGRG